MKAKTFLVALVAIITSPFLAAVAFFGRCRRLAAGVIAAVSASIVSPVLAQLHEVETLLGTVSISDTGGVTIPVDATITSGVGIWFVLFAIGVVVVLLTLLMRFRRK